MPILHSSYICFDDYDKRERFMCTGNVCVCGGELVRMRGWRERETGYSEFAGKTAFRGWAILRVTGGWTENKA